MSLDLNDEIIVKDKLDRILVRILSFNNIVYYRYPDLSLEEKTTIAGLISDLTFVDSNEVMSFLNYEGVDEFCS